MSFSPPFLTPAGISDEVVPFTPKEAQPSIQIENLWLSYRDKIAFKNVTISFNKGSMTAIVGPSGCGKTSFLMCLNRLVDLIPGCRVTGRIQVEDMNVLSTKTDIQFLRRKVGMIFQKPNPFPISIRRNLELPLREFGFWDRTAIEERIEEVLKDVGLWDEVKDRLNSSALALSGGQQQRLCLARALTLTPHVLLMDEPCSALDPISSGVVEDLISRLKNRYTILAVTHNLSQARRIADRVALFWVHTGCGVLIEHGTTQEIFENPRSEITASYVNGIRG